MPARYTETFAEYLEHNEMPAEFSQIDGLADQFAAHFVDHEIGFETETLFKIKFDAMAARKLPLYAARINELTAAEQAVSTPKKTHKTTFDKGKATGKNWELPVNGNVESTPPRNVNTTESLQDVTVYEETGESVDEAFNKAKWFRQQVFDIFDEIYKEFDVLFLKIYF